MKVPSDYKPTLFEQVLLAIGTAGDLRQIYKWIWSRLHRLKCMWMWYRAHVVAHLPGLQMLDGRAVGPEEPQQAVEALRHEEVLMAIMLTSACLVHKLVCCPCRIFCKLLLHCRPLAMSSCLCLSLIASELPCLGYPCGMLCNPLGMLQGLCSLLCDPCIWVCNPICLLCYPCD